jgi:hypothetical protein
LCRPPPPRGRKATVTCFAAKSWCCARRFAIRSDQILRIVGASAEEGSRVRKDGCAILITRFLKKMSYLELH